MIRIGLSHREKQKEIEKLISTTEITKVFCFYYKDFPEKFKVPCETEYIEYSDIEMYKFFYRLLEEINEKSLIVINECLRTQNRSQLIYNCAHHYLNQTPHKIIFEYFPIIDTKDDLMILLDFENKGKYKGKSFDYNYLQTEDIMIKPHKVKICPINVEITDAQREKYEEKKQTLFDNIGNKDPDTIPRELQIFAGDCKKSHLSADKVYIARNKRLKLSNIVTYAEVINGSEKIPADIEIIDTHYRRLNMNDFIKRTGLTKLNYICTSLSIDTVTINDFAKWKARLDAIYAQANIYK